MVYDLWNVYVPTPLSCIVFTQSFFLKNVPCFQGQNDPWQNETCLKIDSLEFTYVEQG